ncbi:MAG: hypothetical protein KGZ58_04125 [Ignavibacteriales bacterium]|nr:hypothetical protein [Ignavibacteriales bacterium]
MNVHTNSGTSQFQLSGIDSITFSDIISDSISTIAFVKTVSGIKQICTINTDGSNFTQLTSFTTNPTVLNKPSYSPDGSLIAFWLNTGSGINVWVMNSNGSNLHQLTFNNEAYIGERIAFSPAMDTVYYRRTTVAGAASIWKIGINGQNNGLFNDFTGNEFQITFVDHSYLLYDRFGGGIYKTNSLTDLTSTLLISGGQWPATNYNLTKIAYCYYGGGTNVGKTYIANIDGSSPFLLSDEGSSNFATMQSFTRDGQYVVYSVNSNIKIVKIDGTGLRTITTGDDPTVKPN